ncbi:MAG: hypothetical protein RL110_370 [Bacteroidota bacterium]|jgi:hypothetical protein
MKTSLFVLLLVGIVSFSCSKKVVPQGVETASLTTKDSTASETQHVTKTLYLDSIHQQTWSHFYAKYSVHYTDSKRSFNFKLSIKSAKDSATTALVSLANIPIFNSLITKDSIVYLNKKDRCYGRFPIQAINKLLGVGITLENLEELFLGLPLGYDEVKDLTEHELNMQDSCRFTFKNEGITNVYVIQLSRPALLSENIQLQENNSLEVQYLEWKSYGSLFVPSHLKLKIISPNETFTVHFTLDKHELDIPQEISIQIPENYAPCN